MPDVRSREQNLSVCPWPLYPASCILTIRLTYDFTLMATINNRLDHQLRLSSYDRVSSWLISLLVVVGVAVTALVLIYVTRQLIIKDFSVPVTPVYQGGGGGTGGVGPPGVGTDLESPGLEESPLMDEPIEDTLSAVTSAVANKTALIADEAIELGIEPVESTGRGDRRTPGSGGGRGGGHGGGIGSGFGPGRGGREPQREIRFEPTDLAEYAQWLDFFKIELGVLGQDNKVYYAYNLSQAKPATRSGDPAQETRLFMNPTESMFAALDRQLAVKAGIADKGRIILQFFPPDTQAILFGLEQKKAGDRTPDQIRRTVFRVTRKGAGFEFSVEEQFYN